MKVKKMKGFIDSDIILITGLFLLTCLGGLVVFMQVHIHKQTEKEKEVAIQQAEFNKVYIKENPDMIPVINAYSECESKPHKVIEGCIDHTVKNDTEKQKLNHYLSSLSEIYVKGMK